MGRCGKCGASLIWIRMAEDWSAMACDKDSLHKVFEGGNGIFITPYGTQIRGNTKGGRFIGYGYIPHWMTCTESRYYKSRLRKLQGRKKDRRKDNDEN